MYYKIHSKLFKESYRVFNSNRQLRENHYETLSLPRDCTTKQIRERFIKLSKEHHPDKNQSKDAHAKYLKIQEAYSVLSKPISRRNYDLGLSNPYQYRQNMYNNNIFYHRPNARPRYGHNPWDDPSFWANRNRNEDDHYTGRPYYGVNGIDKVSNASIVVLCVVVTIFGALLQIMAVRYAMKQENEIKAKQRHSFTIRRDQMVARSNEYQRDLDEMKRRAEENTNEVQIALLKKRLNIKDDDDT